MIVLSRRRNETIPLKFYFQNDGHSSVGNIEKKRWNIHGKVILNLVINLCTLFGNPYPCCCLISMVGAKAALRQQKRMRRRHSRKKFLSGGDDRTSNALCYTRPTSDPDLWYYSSGENRRPISGLALNCRSINQKITDSQDRLVKDWRQKRSGMSWTRLMHA